MIYDERKDKIVSFHTPSFNHEFATKKEQVHRNMKNKKFESYSNEDYSHFMVNSTIAED